MTLKDSFLLLKITFKFAPGLFSNILTKEKKVLGLKPASFTSFVVSIKCNGIFPFPNKIGGLEQIQKPLGQVISIFLNMSPNCLCCTGKNIYICFLCRLIPYDTYLF